MADIKWLDDEREAEGFGSISSALLAAYPPMARHRNANIAKQLDRQLFVAGGLDGNIRLFPTIRFRLWYTEELP
ncbi:MAG: hypothetical protein Fur005_33090 [Roseiflexaceae bacterium]